MSYLLFVIGSIFEYTGMLTFLFIMFRFRLEKQLLINTVLVSILMSQVSYFTRFDSAVGDLSSYIQFVLFVVVLWAMFNVPIFHSIIMNFAGIAALFVIQGIIILISSHISGLTFALITSNHRIAASVQIITFLAMIALARAVYTLNWGFDFVPTSRRSYVKIKGTNAILLSIISISIVVAAILAILLRNNYNDYVLYASVVFILTLPVFLYFSLRKDNEDAT